MMSTAVVSFQVRGAAPKINNSLVMETVAALMLILGAPP
jgi:hypothetical protein